MGRPDQRLGRGAGRRIGVAISPRPTAFGPLLFAGNLTEGLQLAGALGFDVVELSLRESGDIDRRSITRSLNDSGLSVSAVATGQACLFDALCLSSNQASIRKATVRTLRAEIDLAAELGAAVILGGIRGRLEGNLAERAQQRAWALESIAECSRHAADVGVNLLIEAINRYETNFVNTAAEAIDLIDEVGLPGLGVLLDTFHMNIEEVDMANAIRRAGSRLGYVHVVDSNRHAPGQGHVAFEAVLSALDEIGFRGPLVAEVLPIPDDVTAARQTAEFWSSP